MTNELEKSAAFRQTLNESARLLQANRPGEAITLLEPLWDQAPGNVDVAINLGGALILQRKWNRAEAILRQATTANPHNIMLWTNLAAAHLGNLETAGPKQQERAIAAYEKALALDPQAPNIHYHLGLIYKERRDWRNAIAYFEQALAVAPNDRDARRWLDQINAIRADEADSEQP